MKKHKHLLKNVLCSSAFWTINKKLAKEIGYLPTVLLQHFIEIRSYENMPDEFYQQKERIMNDLNFTKTSFDKSLKTLVDMKFISVVVKGLPAKNYYTINENLIVDFLSKEDKDETDQAVKSIPSTQLQNDRLTVKSIPSNTNKQDKNKKEKNKQHQDTLDASTQENTQEDASVEYSSQASSSSLEAKASLSKDIDFDIENGFNEEEIKSTIKDNTSIDIDLDEMVIQESKIEIKNNQTNASSRENIKLDIKDIPQVKQLDSSMTACITNHKDILDGHDKTCYVAKINVAKITVLGQPIDDSSFKEKDFFIPIDKLGPITHDNLAKSLYNFKYSEYSKSIMFDKKLLIKSISIAFQDNEEKITWSKFH